MSSPYLYPPEPNMSLALPIPLVDPTIQYALDINSTFTQVAGHTHLPGSGLPITPAAININGPLSFNAFPLTNASYLGLATQGSTLSGLGFLSNVSGVLYWNDNTGTANVVALGSGSPGSIGGLPSTPAGAAVTYSGGATGSYTFISASTVPAPIIGGPISIGVPTAGGKAITIQAPTGLSSAYNIVLPGGITASTQLMTLTGSGSNATIAASIMAPITGLPTVQSNISVTTGGVLTANASIYNQDGTADLMPAAYPTQPFFMLMGSNGHITTGYPEVSTENYELGGAFETTTPELEIWIDGAGIVRFQGSLIYTTGGAPVGAAFVLLDSNLWPAATRSFLMGVPLSSDLTASVNYMVYVIGATAHPCQPSGALAGDVWFTQAVSGADYIPANFQIFFDGINYLGGN